ncbi:MAG TPA: dTDP-4-dehydrorhamnose reductase, partial [Myxococcota bacterium]
MTTTAMKIWIPGGYGMLGSGLADDARAAGHDVVVSGRDVDVADAGDVAVFIAAHHPAAIVNCAAYTAVDKAESESALAERVNGLAPGVLAAAAATIGARFVHVSTDYVFSGEGDRPLDEQMPTAPVSVYGRTKRDGENAALAASDTTLIVRTSWLYAATHKNFVRTMLALMADREQLRVVADQFGRPTSTTTLSQAILALLDVGARGIVHVADDTGDAGISWHDFAVAIRAGAVERGLPMRVQQVEA